MGLNPPTSKLSPPAVSCDIYLLRWFCQKPSGLALLPYSLICCLVLCWPSSEKEGSGGQPKRPPQENTQSTPRNTTHHTIYTNTHQQHTRWCTGQVGGCWWWVGAQALIIIKGPMICFLHYLEERGSHLNEYQINTLKSLRRTFYCHVQFVHHNRQNTEKKLNKSSCSAMKLKRYFFLFVFVWTNKRSSLGAHFSH